ncbi:hypothetical protein GTP56_23400 [Duganella sp. FT134W]|uniref:Uncharacterized protein n=1 Tax=Duganella margarita TaxID=2692170 RepID=A0A7X4H4D3_9BURK|nr:hypothetical protein [Duganella margarita]MYM75120.1 hypothetical protein [Duganella margarita]
MHNREVLRGAAAAMKVDTALTNKQTQENELSVFSAGPGVAEEKTDGEQRVFYVDGVRLAAWSAAGAKVSATDAAQFTRFMRYVPGGHPQLLERLATPPQLDALRAGHPCDASEDFSDAQILDTMLGKMECMLSTGRQVTLTTMLGGAYKDLGDLLLMQYDSARAWRSWDAGRRVSPALPNFEAVHKFEADLLAKNPQFF